jgi:proteasome lid subunit RPN8/RPN11
MTSQRIKVKVKSQPVVVMEAEVARKIRQHARTSMKAEVCGVLIGSMDEGRTVVDACIAGINAAQGGTHVTFTQDAWEHIYKIKDQQFPDDKIVGWYHSHPGFGVFLSEHDLFIQENFFSSPQQIAWVYDPHTDEEGCFGWVDGKTEKLSGIRTGYLQSVEMNPSHVSDGENEYDEGGQEGFESPVQAGRDKHSREPAWVVWATRILGCLALTALGFTLGYVVHERLWGPKIRTYEEILVPQLEKFEELTRQCDPELRSCMYRLGVIPPPPGSSTEPASGTPGTKPAPSRQGKPASPGKGANGKQ